jgi:hypothetical protein
VSLRNRAAAVVLDALISRVRFYPTDKLGQFPDKPRIWGHVICDEADGTPYLTRVLLPRIPRWVPVVGGVRPMVHKFHRPDVDRDLHSHPWAWMLSLVLAGAYVEERRDRAAEADKVDGEPVATRRRLVRWLNWLTAEDFHRVAELDGELYTLFCVGPRLDRDPTWEFMDVDDGTRVPWREYLDRKKIVAEARRALVERPGEVGRALAEWLGSPSGPAPE